MYINLYCLNHQGNDEAIVRVTIDSFADKDSSWNRFQMELIALRQYRCTTEKEFLQCVYIMDMTNIFIIINLDWSR